MTKWWSMCFLAIEACISGLSRNLRKKAYTNCREREIQKKIWIKQTDWHTCMVCYDNGCSSICLHMRKYVHFYIIKNSCYFYYKLPIVYIILYGCFMYCVPLNVAMMPPLVVRPLLDRILPLRPLGEGSWMHLQTSAKKKKKNCN